MSLLQEAILNRLWARYEREFDAPPPIRAASFDDAIASLRAALATRAARRPARGRQAGPAPLAA